MVVAKRKTRGLLPGLLVASGLSVMGNAMVGVLIPWLVLQETGRPAFAGTIAAVAGVAALLAMVFGGGLIDRVDRRNFAVFADALSAVAVAALPIVHQLFGLTTAWLVALVALGAVFDGPGRAAREALRPAIAERIKVPLERVNALAEVADGVGFLVGPALAGGLVAIAGLFPSFWWSTLVLALAALVFLVTQPKDRKVSDDVLKESYFFSSVQGLKLVWKDPLLRGVAVAAGLFGFVLSPLIFLLTASFEVKGASTELGFVLSSFALGSIAGSLIYAAFGVKTARRWLLITSVTLAGVGLGLMAFFLDQTPVLLVIAALTGLLAAPAGPILSVLLQERCSDDVRGRVLATMGALEATLAPVSLALAGVLIEVTSLPVTYFVFALGTASIGLLVALVPAFRRIERGQVCPVKSA